MKLIKFQGQEFRSINDTDPFDIGDITCLVGKNEAGKTAVLRALYQMNPIIPTHAGYSITDDYPRNNVEDYRHQLESKKREHAIVARAVFELEAEDLEAVEVLTGKEALTEKLVKVTRAYEGEVSFEFPIDERVALQNLLGSYDLPSDVDNAAKKATSVEEVMTALDGGEQTSAVTEVKARLTPAVKAGSYGQHVIEEVIKSRLPKFLYFDEYYQMRGCENIDALKKRQAANTLEPSDYPLLGLINRARLDLDHLKAATRTRELKNSLEGASNHLTKQIIAYWSQNRHLRLLFDVREARSGDPEGMRQGTNIWGEVVDTKHFVTTEMGTRSRGFIWFFSFLAWYGEVRDKGDNVILLLDEPGMSLHGKAQGDLLRYFETEVKGRHQLIYTTHSPFMVDPENFDRVRIVQDLSVEDGPEQLPEKVGTKVLTDILEATGDSLFPLQGALGYDICQTLFVGPNSLVVEGVSDLLFLQGVSGLLKGQKRTGLDDAWTITPVGGSDKIPTFVALLGAQKKLNVAVLMDYQKKDGQMIDNLYKHKLLKKQQVRTYAEFTKTKEADVEDMFDEDFYLELVNGAYRGDLEKPVAKKDLSDKLPRITRRLEDYFATNPIKGGTSFNHFRPAKHFLDNIGSFSLSETTLTRFEEAFVELNKLV